MGIAENVDIKMSENWQLTVAANGDAPMTSGVDSLIQDIKLEAVTQEGELFFDTSYGWSLLDFIQREDTELNRLEIKNRVKKKMKNRTEIDTESITVDVIFEIDYLCVKVTFKVDGKEYTVTVNLNRVNVEVITDD